MEHAVALSQSLSSSSTADSAEAQQDVASDSCTESRLESRSNSKVSAVSVLETESYESIRRRARGATLLEADRCEDEEGRRPASAWNEGNVEHGTPGLRAPGEAVLGCGARGVIELMEHTRRREAAAADDDDDGGEEKEPTAEVVLQPMAASCGPLTEVEVALPFHSDDSQRGEVVAAAGAGLGAEGR